MYNEEQMLHGDEAAKAVPTDTATGDGTGTALPEVTEDNKNALSESFDEEHDSEEDDDSDDDDSDEEGEPGEGSGITG